MDCAVHKVPFRAHETLVSSKVDGWASLAHVTLAGDRRDWEWRGMSAHPVVVLLTSRAREPALRYTEMYPASPRSRSNPVNPMARLNDLADQAIRDQKLQAAFR